MLFPGISGKILTAAAVYADETMQEDGQEVSEAPDQEGEIPVSEGTDMNDAGEVQEIPEEQDPVLNTEISGQFPENDLFSSEPDQLAGQRRQ